jgi:pyruvate,water dikinase
MAKGKEIIKGIAGAPGVAVVTVRLVGKDPAKMAAVKGGEVLVGERFEPEDDEYLKKASALVTDVGGKLSHAAVAGKILGIPAVVGTIEATSVLKEGQVVVVDGDQGAVYEYLPEAGPPAAKSLAERMAEMAAKSGKTLDAEFLEKLKKRGM